MVFSGLALVLLYLLVVHVSKGIDKSDEDSHDENKEIGTVADYLVNHGVAVNESKCMHQGQFLQTAFLDAKFGPVLLQDLDNEGNVIGEVHLEQFCPFVHLFAVHFGGKPLVL